MNFLNDSKDPTKKHVVFIGRIVSTLWLFIAYDQHTHFTYFQIVSLFLRWNDWATDWLGQQFDYEVSEKVYDWLGAFAYEYFLEQAIIATMLFVIPIFNSDWELIRFGTSEFLWIWLLLIPWTLLQYEHEISPWIHYSKE